ncbi:MAG: ribonuclease, partial [Thermoleophilaceae bacterium]|nr:ribonuclease [Thermoleophilaceae bacterium]
NPRVTQLLARGPGRPLLDVEKETGKHFHFEGSEGLPTDHFAVTLEGTRSEVEDRALPFREGEEVLVQINEPHMYAEDDAVAKIDGYVIAVAGAGKYIGEKRLVRIEAVGRTAASGVLADAPVNGEGPKSSAPSSGSSSAPPRETGGGDDDDKPKARRRGRRGGRGRSKAGTAAEAAEGS